MGYLGDMAAARRERRLRLAGRHPDAGPLVPRPRPKIILIVNGRQWRPPPPQEPPPASPKSTPVPLVPPAAGVPPRIERIVRVVADAYGISVDGVMEHRRTPPARVEARQVVMYLSRELSGFAYPKIGRRLGRDHSTVIYAHDKIAGRLPADPELARRVEAIRREVVAAQEAAP
jgi:hypothetical protein